MEKDIFIPILCMRRGNGATDIRNESVEVDV